MIVTVAVDGLPGIVPGGVVKVTVKVSSPSKAIMSSSTVNSTQAVSLLAAKIAVNVSITKSSPPLKENKMYEMNLSRSIPSSHLLHFQML